PLARVAPTIGAGIALQETARWYFGPEQKGFPSTIALELWELGPLRVSSVQVFILAAALVLMGAVHLFLGVARAGGGVRGTAEEPTVAGLLGVNVRAVVMLTFFVASTLAGAAGGLGGLGYKPGHPVIGG